MRLHLRVRRQLGGKERWQESKVLILGLASTPSSKNSFTSAALFLGCRPSHSPPVSYTHLRSGFPHGSSARRSTDLLSHLKATPLSNYSISVLNATTMPISWVENLSMISDWASGHLPDQLASWPRTSLLAFPDPLAQT